MRIALIIILPLTFLLSGCAKMMNENECLAADWQTVGFLDGSSGRNMAWLERRSEACSEYGVAPDLDRYLIGRSQGLESFCQPRSGFYMGLRRNIYENVCPTELEGAFLVAYQDGLGLRERQNRITEIESAINSANADMIQLDEDIATATLAVAAPDTTEQDRLSLAVEIRNMAEERGNIEVLIPQLEAELTAARVDLDDYRLSITSKYPGAI